MPVIDRHANPLTAVGAGELIYWPDPHVNEITIKSPPLLLYTISRQWFDMIAHLLVPK